MAFGHDEMLRIGAVALACAPLALLSLGLAGFGRSSRDFASTAFFGGALAGLVGFATYFVIIALPHLLGGGPLAIADGFVGAAVPEEFAKYVLFIRIVSAHEDAEIGLDVILGMAWIGLGFACLENLLFVTSAKNVYQVGFIRAMLSVPLHFTLGIVMGSCLVMAKQPQRSARLWTVIALLVPIALHGAYDSGLFLIRFAAADRMTALVVVAGVIILIAVLVAAGAVTVIARFGAYRLDGSGRPIGTVRPKHTIERVGRGFAVTICALFALFFLPTIPLMQTRSPSVVPLWIAIGVLMLALTVLFWRGPAVFRRRAAQLSSE